MRASRDAAAHVWRHSLRSHVGASTARAACCTPRALGELRGRGGRGADGHTGSCHPAMVRARVGIVAAAGSMGASGASDGPRCLGLGRDGEPWHDNPTVFYDWISRAKPM